MGFQKSLRKILQFELLWKLVFFCLLNPVFSGIYSAYVSMAGLSFNGGIVWTFLNLKGGVIFLLLFFGAAWLVFYEYSVVIRIAALCRQGEEFTLRQVMRASLWDLGLLRGWSLIPGSVYYVLLLPLVGVFYVSTMVPKVTIPWFIFGEMQKTTIGVVGIAAIIGAYFLIHLLLAFVPVGMVLRRQRFGQAAGESLRYWGGLSWRDRLSILAVHIIWSMASSELARYWRRNLLDSGDFNGDFFQYLIYNEGFRKDLLWWLLLVLLQTAAMAGMVYFLTTVLNRAGTVQISSEPAWSEDGEMVWGILSRRWGIFAAKWRDRMKTHRWRAGAAAVCLALAAGLLLSLENALLVHPPLAIAHRGGIGGIENSLEAVLSAAEQGADYAEIDVQLTKDGVPVLFHDGNLRRMAGRGESIGDLTWFELEALSTKDNNHPGETAKIASLEQVIQALSRQTGTGLLIELKPAVGTSEALADAVIALVERYGFGDRAMFMSLDYLCLLPIMERHPEWWTGCCAYRAAGDIDDAVWRYQADFLAIEEELVSYPLVTRARELSLPVYVWSVYDSEKMTQYLEMGITGLITDIPELALEARDTYRDSHPDTEYIWMAGGLPRKDELDRW